MKKILSLILVTLLMMSVLAGCGASAKPSENENEDADFVWTRQGSFEDADGNYLLINFSDTKGYEGWGVTCMLGDDMYGWIIPQEGRTLHGDIDYEENHEFIVTVSEEGEDGLKLEVEGGETYHFTPMEVSEAALTVTVNIEGMGQIAYAAEGEELQFDDNFPAQSAYLGLEEPETYVFEAKADEGWKFLKWTKDGADYATDEQITVALTESMELVAVFGMKGKDETHVDLETVTTLGEVLGLPEYAYSASENTYVYVFEQDGNYYRAVAESSPDVFDAIFELDWDDEQYDEKKAELISPLKVTEILNLSEAVPAQEELDQLVGKTGEDLLNDGWTVWGWNLEDMEFNMYHGFFNYKVRFTGTLENSTEFEEEDIKALIVESVVYDGLGDPARIKETEQ